MDLSIFNRMLYLSYLLPFRMLSSMLYLVYLVVGGQPQIRTTIPSDGPERLIAVEVAVVKLRDRFETAYNAPRQTMIDQTVTRTRILMCA